MSQKVFVSPGVFTSEKDLTFVTRQVGVTSLGLVGETTIGPAFQPIFIGNYNEFQSFFGGLDNTLVKDTLAPAYELPYIAKSYLSQANQLFVTRVLGLSGYEAGMAWAITLNSAPDTANAVQTIAPSNQPNLISFTATTGGTNITLVSSQPLVQTLINNKQLTSALAFLGAAALNSTAEIGTVYLKTGSSFSGVSMSLVISAKATSGGFITGTASGITTYFSASTFPNVENQVVAVLRSRAKVNTTSQLPVFEVSNATGLSLGSPTAEFNPIASFNISGTSATQGAFAYSVSLDRTQKNFISKVLGKTSDDSKTALYVEDLYGNMFQTLLNAQKVGGVKMTMINYTKQFDDYKTEYQPAVTPYVVSELRGNKMLRLFRLWTISDGNAANTQFKISITNIKPDVKEFDLIVRNFRDTDSQMSILENFGRCTMDPSSTNFIGKKIGTLDGTYPSKSAFILVDLDDSTDTSDTFPAGFVGYTVRDYTLNSNPNVKLPSMNYKSAYAAFENKRRSFLGLSDTTGIDADFFDYKGKPLNPLINQWTGFTKGFHMDIDASGATIDNVELIINATGGTVNPNYQFEAGAWEFRTDGGLVNGPYERLYARKFTFAPAGGFDGWDIYRTRRSNTDPFVINGTRGAAGLTSGAFASRIVSNGDRGTTSDYYAFLEGIYTFNNAESININVFSTPGIDNFENANLVEAAIEMIEQERADSLYIMTTPDTNSGEILAIDDVVETLYGQFDSSYSATYWPWIQVNDAENNVFVYMPPTRDVVRNIALTDNIAFPWFTVAGVQRGDVDAVRARVKLTNAQRDDLYEARINPIATFASDGIKVWGNKTLQVKDTALNRINVRRLLLQARKLISAVAIRLLFEQNDTIVRNQFLGLVNPILDNIRRERGLVDFRVVVSNDPEEIDRNELKGKIFLKPTRALEFIEIEFNVMKTGASFDNI